jgi:alkanesulfonate monooxygenase SsuD/methylene tetrahydromethanopterin reductase-like flavin-dependent oxidoreductase (luciferase family)
VTDDPPTKEAPMPLFPDRLRFGIHAGQQYTDFPSYLELWRTAEEVGLDWASVFDHFLPIQADPAGPCFEGLTLLSAMAAHTERLRCGIIVTGVTNEVSRARR